MTSLPFSVPKETQNHLPLSSFSKRTPSPAAAADASSLHFWTFLSSLPPFLAQASSDAFFASAESASENMNVPPAVRMSFADFLGGGGGVAGSAAAEAEAAGASAEPAVVGGASVGIAVAVADAADSGDLAGGSSPPQATRANMEAVK